MPLSVFAEGLWALALKPSPSAELDACGAINDESLEELFGEIFGREPASLEEKG